MGNSESKPDVVVAIEIGRVNSGFAYSFECSKNQIYTAHHGCVLPTARVPTILLLDKEKKFHSFGTVARDRYMALSLQEEHNNYSYFNNLEVVPGGQYTEYVVKDSEGNSMNAKQIYSIVIEYLYTLAIANIRNNGAKSEKVRVVFTIPESYGDYMWDIIHAAARNVGIEEELICIISSVDASALYCSKQNLVVDTYLGTGKIKTKFILMDLGGRKTEILVKLFDGNTRKNIHEAKSISCGGESVTELFLSVLGSMKDKKEWSNFQNTCIYDYECIKLNFEKLKHKFDGTGKFILELPESFCKLPENNECEQSNILEEIVYAADNKIMLTQEAMKKLFDPTVEQIVNELKSVKMSDGQRGEEVVIMLAGGFSESRYVRKTISREMNPSKVLLVPNASLDVLIGAVITGYAKFRRAQYSYGLLSPVASNQCELPQNMMTEKGKQTRQVFDTIIEKREEMECGRVYRRTLKGVRTNGTKPIEVTLYKTKKATTGIDSEKSTFFDTVGTVQLQAPALGWQEKVLDCALEITVIEKGFQLVLTEQPLPLWQGRKEVSF